MAKKKDSKDEDKTPKKKRKVGRPKKRGRKKKYYKKKKTSTNKKSSAKSSTKPRPQKTSGRGFASNNSYNKVRSILWKNFKDEFSSYNEFISNEVDPKGNKIEGSSIVSRVYNECKSIECSDDDILAIYRQFKQEYKSDDVPLVPSDYYNPRAYYQLLTENLWDGMDERLWIYAPMLIPPPSSFLAILGEDRCVDKDGQTKESGECTDEGDRYVKGKKEYFAPFVDYCNQFQMAGIYTTSEEVPHIKFIGKDGDESPYWNEEKSRWEIQIVICTPFGDIDDYDFDPLVDGDQDIPDEEDLPPTGKSPEKPKEPTDKPEKTSEKDIELEKEKRKTLEQREKTSAQEEKTALAQAKLEEKKIISDIMNQWKRGDIDKGEMMELIKLIKS